MHAIVGNRKPNTHTHTHITLTQLFIINKHQSFSQQCHNVIVVSSLCACIEMHLFYRLSNITSSKSIVLNSPCFLHLHSVYTAATDVQCKFPTLHFFSLLLCTLFHFLLPLAILFLCLYLVVRAFMPFLKMSKLAEALLTHDDLNNNKQDASRWMFWENGCTHFAQRTTSRAKFHRHCAFASTNDLNCD